jgi:hypothetical protein
VTFDLGQFASGVRAKAAIWSKLGVAWRLKAVMPNHEKPVVACIFESVSWLAEMTVWITGEAELVAVRPGDGWNVNKHCDLASADDLEIALGELVSLIAEASVPCGAVTAWVARGQ